MAGRISRRTFVKAAGSALAGYGLVSVLRGRVARAAGARPPNILLVFPDQMRRDWTALNPALPVRTPNLSRLAAEGMRFERAYCPAPVCAPSRACLAQGKRYGATGVLTNNYDNPDGVETFYQHLRDAGYRVGSVGKTDLRKAAFDWGPDGLHRTGSRCYFQEWGFTDGFDSEGKSAVIRGVKLQRKAGAPLNPYAGMLDRRGDGSLETYLRWYEQWRLNDRENSNYGYTTPCDLPDDAYNDNWVGANALALLREEFPSAQPWFLQVNFPGPHNPMDVTRDMAGWYRDAVFPPPVANTQYDPEIHQRIRRSYSAMVDNIDRWLGRFLAALEERGELDRTLVVFSSDHGEMLGEHDCWGKCLPYEASASVPLIVRGPGVLRGGVHSGVTTTLDLAATFLDAAGRPTPAGMHSRSLSAVLAGTSGAGRPHIDCALQGWRMVCDGRFKLVDGIDLSRARGYDGGLSKKPDEPGPNTGAANKVAQLFDLQTDPAENENVITRHPDVAARLRAVLPPQAFV